MNVLITGAASGIGRAVTEKFLATGDTVYAVDISAVDIPKVFMLTADITDESQVGDIKSRLTTDGVSLDLIINVAGVHAMASFVESDYIKMHRLIEINLCGAMLINRTLHSLLSPMGRIIIVTSEVAPLDPMPFNGLYNVSKTALDCYAQSLRQELNLLGQRVITVRPGAVATPLSRGSLTDTDALAESTVLYRRQASRFGTIVSKFMGTPISPDRVARLIHEAAISRHPKLIYHIHRNPGLVLLNILPKRLQCFVIKLLLG